MIAAADGTLDVPVALILIGVSGVSWVLVATVNAFHRASDAIRNAPRGGDES